MINSLKNNLLNLPDSIFFDIMRNYLGDLKTPFNKHDLIRSLITIISGNEVRDRIFRMIDQDDSRLLTAVGLLDAAPIEELYDFTKQYYSFLELHNRVANLQERLLLCVEYPDRGSRGRKMIRLNPVFEDELVNGYLDTSAVFPSLSTGTTASRPWLSEQLISAFISFAVCNRGIFSENGNSRRKAESRFSSVFSNLAAGEPVETIDYLKRVCTVLGFFRRSGGFSINTDRIAAFGRLSPEDRSIMTASAAVSVFSGPDTMEFSTSSVIISHLFRSIPSGTRIHENDLESFFYLIRRNAARSSSDAASFTGKLLTDALCRSGHLVKDDGFRIIRHGGYPESGEKLRVQSNFEISAPAGFPLSREIHAACCSEIKTFDITRTYEITKQSFAAALDSGLDTAFITEALSESSAGGIPQNIKFSINAWTKEYQSISLNYGIVMTVSPDRLPLIEHNPELKDYFTAVPAPGVFILDSARENEWRKAFADAGFEMLPAVPAESGTVGVRSTTPEFRVYGNAVELWDNRFKDDSAAIIEELTERIGRLSIPAEQKQKLEARTRKKLILTDSQLTVSNKPEERGEAGGLDHRAKIRLTERALELENLLEVTTARDLELEKRLIKPLKLVKSEAASPDKPPVYRIEGIELPEETEFSIPVTRVSYLRMLKSSLFTP